MNSHPIKTTHAKGEPMPPNTVPDHDWFRANEQRLLEEYGECVVIIYQQAVIGTGKTYREAVEDARRNVAPDSPVITPIMRILQHDNPFMRARPFKLPKSEQTEG
jgi:hypothetical protein